MAAGPVLSRGGITAGDHRRDCPRRSSYVWHVWEDRGPAKIVLPRPYEKTFACIAPGPVDWSRLEGSLAQYSRSGPSRPINKDACRDARPTARIENIDRGTLTRLTVSSLIFPPCLLVGCACSTVVAAWCNWGGWRCSGKLLLLCDKARKILAATSAWFGHFREVFLVMEARPDAKGLAAEILFFRTIRSRSDRILQNAGLSYMLTMTVLRNRLLLPGAGIASKIIKGDEDALRFVKPTGSDPFEVQRHRHQEMRGVLPVELLGWSPREKGVYTRRWERAIMPPTWACAGRSAQRHGFQR